MLNCWYIDAAVSRDAADAALTAMVKRHTRKKLKGRPPSIPPERLRDAKRLRERRLTHGQIARKLGLKDSKAVGSALRYHFPDEPSAKNSR